MRSRCRYICLVERKTVRSLIIFVRNDAVLSVCRVLFSFVLFRSTYGIVLVRGALVSTRFVCGRVFSIYFLVGTQHVLVHPGATILSWGAVQSMGRFWGFFGMAACCIEARTNNNNKIKTVMTHAHFRDLRLERKPERIRRISRQVSDV